ncbi:MAG: hypothetical protein HC859_08305 [Bacteroidia bacterium]|nr:hypothetical protein [Bacteroidia bacterium]
MLFSFSAFKLPHYINVLLPFFAIMTAGAITSAKLRTLREYMLTQKILGALVVVLFGVIHIWAFPIVNPWVIAVSVLLFLLIVLMMAAPGARMRQVVCLSAALGVWIIFSLNFSYYPQLLGYQAGLPLAAAINHEKEAPVAYVVGGERCNDLDFALGVNVPAFTPTEIEQAARPFFVVTGNKGLHMLTQNGLHYTKLAEAADFKVSKFRYSFFNPATRDSMLEKIYLLEIH